ARGARKMRSWRCIGWGWCSATKCRRTPVESEGRYAILRDDPFGGVRSLFHAAPPPGGFVRAAFTADPEFPRTARRADTAGPAQGADRRRADRGRRPLADARPS